MAKGHEGIVLKVLEAGQQGEESQALPVIRVWVLKQDEGVPPPQQTHRPAGLGPAGAAGSLGGDRQRGVS